MSTWLDLTFREAVILALLAALGAGPAAFLRGTQAGTRLALAPAFGLGLGAAALVSAGYVTSLGTAAWAVLLPMIVVSLTIFVVKERRRQRGGERSPGVATAPLKIGLFLVVVTAALNYPLAHRESLGPVAYRVTDASGYVALNDRLESHRFSDRSGVPPWDLTSTYGDGLAQMTGNHPGVSALPASSNSVLGWRASDTQSVWTIVLVVLISLGAFAAVQEFTRSRTWAAPFAGLLVAGPFMYQLFVDGSQGALAFLALFPPLAVLGGRVIKQPRKPDVVLIALLLAGGLSVYEAGVPSIAVWGALVVAVIGVAAAVKRRLEPDVVWRTARIVTVVILLVIVMAPVAFARSIDFYHLYLTHQFDTAGIPYNLPVEVIPSWLLQSRELYGIQENPAAFFSFSQFLVTVLVPAALTAVAIFGILRYPKAWVVAAVIPVAAVLAYRSYQATGGELATYQVDRSLLIVAVAGVILLSIGLAAMSAAGSRTLRIGAVAIGAVAIALAGLNSYAMARRVLEGGQIVPGSVRQSLPEMSGLQGTLYLEGLGAGFPNASFEMSAIYNLVNEATRNQLALDMANNDYHGPQYLGGFLPEGPWFDPGYRWVFTVIPGVRTSRTPVARFGSVAIERRTRRLDVTVGSGIAIDPPWDNSEGDAWVQDQLKLLVTGASRGPVWVRLQLQGSAVRPVGPPGARVVAGQSGRTMACIPVGGTGALREAVASFRFEPEPWPAVPSRYALSPPNHSLKLAGMWAVHHCGPHD